MKLIIKYIRIVCPHLSMALLVLAMALGYFYNWRGKAVLLTTDKTNVFVTKNKELKIVPYALTLTDFIVECYESGEPKNFEAIISVEENNCNKTISLRVNHPKKMAFGQDMYLLSYDQIHPKNPEFCVVELVHDPFQGLFLAGIILLFIGLILSVLN